MTKEKTLSDRIITIQKDGHHLDVIYYGDVSNFIKLEDQLITDFVQNRIDYHEFVLKRDSLIGDALK